MASPMTLLELRTAVRQRADMETSQLVSDVELNSYVNQSLFELYDILVEAYGNNYYVQTPFNITTNGNDSYDLPTDFYKLLGVDLALSTTNDSWVTVRPFNFSERNRYAVPNFQSFYGITNLRYRLNGSKIWFTPIPKSGQTIRLWYVPAMTQLVSDSDTFDSVNGWSEYVITDAAIKCLIKEESDPSALLAIKANLLLRITSAANNRDAGTPQTVTDNQSAAYWWPNSGNGSGFY